MTVLKRSEQFGEKARCVQCGQPIRDPFLTGGLNVCEHRRACEARQMLAAGEPIERVAAHAQGRGA